MAHSMPDNIFHNEINQSQTYNWKHKIEGKMVILYQITFQQVLDKMRQIFKNNGSYTGRKTNQYTQYRHKLFVRNMFGSPDEKVFKKWLSWHRLNLLKNPA